MPGGFWQGNAQRPLRRRRSLLGRKIRSDNDLTQQDTDALAQPKQQQSAAAVASQQIPRNVIQQQSPRNVLQQQEQQQRQQQQPQPITKVVLPENVKTILIAGTPECWSLSTSTEVYSPTNCDASLLTVGSELSPNTMTIDEDEPFHGNHHEGLEWLRSPPPCDQLLGTSPLTCSTKGRSSTNSKTRQAYRQSEGGTQQQPQQLKEPSSMIVMYRSQPRAAVVLPPQEALHVWLHSADALLKSKEFSALVMSTGDVVKAAGGLAVKTAFLPVTLPFHMACATKDFIGWTLHQALEKASGHQTGVPQLTNGETTTEEDEEANKAPASAPQPEPERQQQQHHHGNPFEGLLSLVPVVLQTAGKVKDEIGSAVIAIVTPPQPREKDTSKACSDDKQALDRLIIPGVVAEEEDLKEHKAGAETAGDAKPAAFGATKADYSKFLLRVEDLGITLPDGTTVVLYVDLSDQFRDMPLLTRCLEQVASRGLAMATAHAPTIPPASPGTDNPDLEWRTEGATAKLLRKKARQTTERWDETIRSEVLIWSGSFKKQRGGSDINQQYSLFMARGIVDRMSPREFLELMWDNDRTMEYNHFCMGRVDILPIEDDVLSDMKANTGIKVVKSETRVPFTGLSVTLFTMMHCRPLPGGPEEGFVIVSRSLNCGMAGCHTSRSSKIDAPKSEILWGVNVLRAVPGHPDQTELTSLSQVASSMVPKFLSQRIGIMGVEDFFRNVRSPPKVTSPTKSSKTRNSTSTTTDSVESSPVTV